MLLRIRWIFIRRRTSKGSFFLARDLPFNPAEHHRTLLAAIGSLDSQQIDGVGGADPLPSKVGIVHRWWASENKKVRHWWQLHCSRSELLTLGERELADIGRSRSDAHIEGSKWFWQR